MLSIFTNHIVRNQEFSLLTLHTRGQSPKVVALQNVHMAVFFLPRRRTLKGSLGRAGMKTETMVERPFILFFHKKKKKQN